MQVGISSKNIKFTKTQLCLAMSLALGSGMAHANVVTNETELVAAIDSYQTEITLGDNITIALNSNLPEILTNTTINGNASTLNGGGHTCIDSGAYNLTLKNIIITGCDNSDGDGGAVTSTGGTVTVKNSTISDNSAKQGGGIYVFDGDLTIKDSIISGNTASPGGSGGGGGIYFYANSPQSLQVIDSDITDNTITPFSSSQVRGGGLRVAGDGDVQLTIKRSEIRSNTTSGDALGAGISITLPNSHQISIKDTVIKGNTASLEIGDLSFGGGLFIESEAFELSNLHIKDNEAGIGGGAFLQASNDCGQANNGLCGTLKESSISGNEAIVGGGIVTKYTEVVDSTISGNQAYYYYDAGGDNGDSGGDVGGVLAKYSVISNSTISGNEAGGDVGGITAKYTQVLNSTISGNEAGGDVGGLYASGGQIINSTISGNEAVGDIGGAYLVYGSMIALSTMTKNTAVNVGGLKLEGGTASASALLEGVIIADNNAGTHPDLQLADPPSDLEGLIRYSVIGVAPSNTLSETVLVDVNPMLGPLADNGGETFTHAPSLGSPARFLVPADKCADISDTDQRGESRPSETACTAGSVEVQGSVPDPVPVPIMSSLAVMLSAAGMALFGWLGLRRRPRF